MPSLIAERYGRLHTTFNQAVAATGRLLATNLNLQSIPSKTDLGRQIRSAFIAEEGHRLRSADDGNWTVQSGTGTYAGARGRGTYTFDTKIVAGSFTLMEITLNGSIS